jgi:hypothetical protein
MNEDLYVKIKLYGQPLEIVLDLAQKYEKEYSQKNNTEITTEKAIEEVVWKGFKTYLDLFENKKLVKDGTLIRVKEINGKFIFEIEKS